MAKPKMMRGASPAIFLMIILLVNSTEAKPWWQKVGDSIGGVVGAIENFKPVEIGLSIKGGSCLVSLLSINVRHDECISRNDARASLYVNIEKIPENVSIDSILKMPIDFVNKHYPNFLKAWRFNKKINKRPRRAL